MDAKTIMPVLVAFTISVIACPILIPFLKKLKFGQYIRTEGPESHQKKSGTPTMGGLVFLFSILVTSLLFLKGNTEIIPVLFATIGFGAIGFMDDYIKVVLKRNLGLRAWQKMLGQILVTGIFAYYIMNYTELGTTILIPFTSGMELELSFLYIPFLFLVFLGTVNGANFTDGLDGLASTVTLVIAGFLSVVAITSGSGIAPITCAVVGSLLGFLIYNVYPARVFMGDTGSLALGGFVAASAYMLKMPLIILFIGIIYLAEVLSVMIQVAYFKATKGKRIFRMAPIHHHFELGGWSETRVVAIFSIVTTILCLIAWMAI